MYHIRVITKEVPAHARFYAGPFMGLAELFMSTLLKIVVQVVGDKELPTG